MIKILGTKVLVKEVEQDLEKTDGGLYLPASAQQKKQLAMAEVVSFGVDCQQVQVGDIIYLDAMRLMDFSIGDEPYKLCEEGTIMAIDRK